MNSLSETSFAGLKTMQLNDQKAGMEGLDKETINKIIYEASNGTPYFAFQEKRQKSIDSKVNELQREIKKITESKRKESLKQVDALCKSMEAERDSNHSIVHIDMDAFYAAVEMNDNPDLRDKPMAVGSLSMLSTSNYLARKYGVRAAMPGFIAKKLCQNLVIVPTRFNRYRDVSKVIRKIVEQYDPDYSAASLDEVYLDLSEYIMDQYRKQRHEQTCSKNGFDVFIDDDSITEGTGCDYKNCMSCVGPISNEDRDKMAFDVVQEIRDRIFQATNLTASAGIAPNTMLAKVCSDQKKPNGQYQIPSTVDAVKSFISTLPVKKVSGIGPVQGQILNAIGIVTCEDMWSQRHLVANLFSANSVDFYMRVALGLGSINVKSDYDRKSIGNERTFHEISKPEELHKKCEDLCWTLLEDLKSHKFLGKVLVLKIKTTSFKTFTRNHTLPFYTDDLEVISNAAKKLLDAEISAAAPQPLKLRLMGLRMCSLVPADSIASSKKQITLKSFLQSKTVPSLNKAGISASSEELTCPTYLNASEDSSNNFQEHLKNSANYQYCSEQMDGIEEPNTSYQILCNVNENCIEMPDKFNFKILNYYCPVCDLDQKVGSLTELNQHIDGCLNKKEIKKILASQCQKTEKRKSSELQNDCPEKYEVAKKVRIEDYFKQSSIKQV